MSATVFAPGTLFARGRLAKMLGVTRYDVRYISGVLDEVRTRGGLIRYEFRRDFVTRSQAAKILHKSKTAVVAVEGVLLYPELGPGDVRLFHVEDVNGLAGASLGSSAQSTWLRRKREVQDRANRRPFATGDQSAEQLQSLRHENMLLRTMLAEQIDAWATAPLAFGHLQFKRGLAKMLEEHVETLATLGH